MDITQILGYPSAPAPQAPPATERPAYLTPEVPADGPGYERTAGRGDTAMSAGALALLAIAGLVGLRVAFRGALP
jgi:hypothetical protein